MELASCGKFTEPLRNASWAVAIVLLPGAHGFDAGRAAQNMMLAAWSLGVASCPVFLHDQDCARRVLKVPPGHTVAAAICFGFPAGRDPRALGVMPGGRRPLEELVFEGEFGRTWRGGAGKG